MRVFEEMPLAAFHATMTKHGYIPHDLPEGTYWEAVELGAADYVHLTESGLILCVSPMTTKRGIQP